MIHADFAKRIKEAVARHVARSNGMLKLQVRELVGKTLKERVCSNGSSTGPETAVVVRECFPHDAEKPIWHRKDLVYRVQCLRSAEQGRREFYTGETQMKLKKRFYYHWHDYIRDMDGQLAAQRDDPQSALTEHYRAEHAGQAMKLKIIDLMPTEGIVDRKCTESVVQRTHESSINRRNEGAGHVGDLYY